MPAKKHFINLHLKITSEEFNAELHFSKKKYGGKEEEKI